MVVFYDDPSLQVQRPSLKSSAPPSAQKTSPSGTPRFRDSCSSVRPPVLTRSHDGGTQKDRPASTRPLSMCPITATYRSSHLAPTSRMVRRFSDSSSGPPEGILQQELVGLSYTPELPKSARDMPSKQDIVTGCQGFSDDERRSRRYGTDFGARTYHERQINELKMPYEEWSPTNKTPTTIYSASVSEDGFSSIYDSTAFDFPEPPPIASPVIRRMQSTSWFMDDHPGLQNLSEPEKRMRIAFGKPLPPAPQPKNLASSAIRRESPMWDRSESSTSTVSGHYLGLLGDNLFGLDTNERVRGQSPDQNHASSDLDLTWSNAYPVTVTPRATKLKFSQSTPVMPAYENPEVIDEPSKRPMGRLPRIIRKVASMRSDTQKFDAPVYHPPSGHAGRRSIPKARSFRSILRSGDQPQTRLANFGLGGASNRPPSWLQKDSPYHGRLDLLASESLHKSGSKLPVSANGGKLMPQNSSIPLTSENYTFQEKRGSIGQGVLAGPFSHRPLRNQTTKKGSPQQDLTGPNSFINLSPDRREAKVGTKRERMKDFFTGIVGWGKQRKSKGSSAKQ